MKKFEEGDYYLSPEGFRIFTAQYLKKEDIVVKVVANIARMDTTKKQIK